MLSFLLALVGVAAAAPRAEAVRWSSGGVEFAGWVVWDDATATPRPGLVMVPNWYGVNAAAVEKAKSIAGTRYVILLADVYGAGTRPADDAQAKAAVGPLYADRALLRARAGAALAQLRAQAGKVPLDPARIGAIGFCFGGSTVLELARSGADLDGVVSFHGGLGTPSPAGPGGIRASVLALNGAADTYVPAEDIAAFEKEMGVATRDWQLVQLGGAVHCFTEVGSASPGCAYDERAARRAYTMMDDFFGEVLK